MHFSIMQVEIKVNDKPVPYAMKLGEAGEAFFVFETEHEVPEEFQTSPLMEAVQENRTDEVKVNDASLYAQCLISSLH